MKKYNLVNNITGWIVFAIAAVVYLHTIEPTASFWDCPEFISAAYKLEVGHPPGAPFFMLAGKFFSLFASEPSTVAKMINSMSAIFSALTILFLFWTITHLAKKLIVSDNKNVSTGEFIAVMGAGIVGSLAYTFSDTFWYSATEGEVYAFSSLFTALVFWAILKWEDYAETNRSDKWLVLIAYLMGLSIGVHLLNLLAIPAIVLVYYFKKYNPTIKGTLLAIAVSGGIIGITMYGMIPGVVNVAGWFDLFFVNTLGLPFNSGIVAYIILVFASLVWTLFETYKGSNDMRIKISFIISVTLLGIPFIGDSVGLGIFLIAALSVLLFIAIQKINTRILNTIVLSLTVLLIGYFSYAVIYIRSEANPPMDQNSPRDPFSLESYLNREQYGERPLFYGRFYDSPRKLEIKGNMCSTVIEEKGNIWIRKIKESENEKDKYISTGKKLNIVYDEKFNMLLPRMWSADHAEDYKKWGEIKGTRIRHNQCGEVTDIYKPTFVENLRYMINYQINYMYWRYFMWNFSGRQNDIQGHGEACYGNWITGFNFIDKHHVGDQTDLPFKMENNKGHNTYYMIPLLLGIIGIFFQLNSEKKGLLQFSYTFILFFMTGLAIVLYLNQTPLQPRERDYAYAGSFYAFCIWIGFGVLGLIRLFQQMKLPLLPSALIATALASSAPAIMASENWDDHDRSNRFTCRDFGYNYLASCAPNAVIFTYGDNDTFPLWYLQEVEGIRTDVRVCNLSYLSTDWYISQMKRASYESKPLPISWTIDKYIADKRSYARINDRYKKPLELGEAMSFLLSEDEWTRRIPGYPELEDYIPASQFYLNIDTAAAKKHFSPAAANKIQSRIDFSLSKGSLYRSESIVLEMLSQNNKNNWERPIYYAVTVPSDNYLGLSKFFSLEGMAYRIVPSENEDGAESIDTELMYDNMMNKFKWGGIDNPNVYLDENILKMCLSHRQMFSLLVSELIEKDEKEKALNAIDYCLKVIPVNTVGYDFSTIHLAYSYYMLGKNEKAEKLLMEVMDDIQNNLNWFYKSMNKEQSASSSREIYKNVSMFQNAVAVCMEYNQELFDKYYPELEKFMNSYNALSKK